MVADVIDFEEYVTDRLGGVHYRMMITPEDKEKVINFFLQFYKKDEFDLEVPTVFAEYEGTIIGAMATYYYDDKVVAGPFQTVSRHPWVVLRLFEAYELIMRKAGVQQYFFSLPKNEERFKRVIEKALLIKSYKTDDDGDYWYLRELDYGQEESSGADSGREGSTGSADQSA